MENFDNIPDQAHFFYNEKWNKEKDSVLLRSTLVVKKITDIVEGTAYQSPHARLMALGDINGKFGTNLRLLDIEMRLTVLHNRYKTFRALMKMPETRWCRETNVITTVDRVWERVFQANDLARAYYHQGEPEYYKMCAVFGLNDIKHEPIREVINISESVYIEQLSSDEEVTSPVFVDKGNASRSLSGDDAAQPPPIAESSGASHSPFK